LTKKTQSAKFTLHSRKSEDPPPSGKRIKFHRWKGFPGGLIFIKHTVEYELLFFTTVANEEKIGSIKKDITEILESLGGKMSGDFSDIGKRKLAHPIKKNTHAFFSFVRFELDGENRQNIPEIGKRLGLLDSIVRHIIVRADEIGKPIISQGIRFEEEKSGIRPGRQEEKRTRPPQAEKPAKPSTEAKPDEQKAKASLSELDEKLTEILEEIPE